MKVPVSRTRVKDPLQPADADYMPDILPGGGEHRGKRSFFDSLPRSARERWWRWIGIGSIVVGLFLWKHGQAPTPQAHGNLAFALTGVLLALSGCVVTLLSFRRR